MSYVATPFNYTGSKHNYLSELLPHFDYSKSTFVDVFTGGGSLYSNVVSLYKVVVVNDYLAELVTLHKELLHNTEETLRSLKKVLPQKSDVSTFVQLRSSFNSSRSYVELYALMLSCTNNMLRFNKSGHFNQTFGYRTYNSSTEKKLYNWVSALQEHKHKLRYTSDNFTELLNALQSKYNVLPQNCNFYLDPPYLGTCAGYNSTWKQSDENEVVHFCEEVNKLGGTFALSGVLLPSNAVSVLSKKYNSYTVKSNYSKSFRNKSKKSYEEVLVTNKN